MRYSYKQLNNLRSGQMVWRVLFRFEEDRWGGAPVLRHTVTPTWVIGKKTTHWFRHHETRAKQWSSVKMEFTEKFRVTHCSYRDNDNPMSVAHFLNDLNGSGAFSSQRHAERFVKEVYSGLYPEFVKREMDMFEMDREFDRHRDDWDSDPIYTGEDLGDEGLREIDSGEHLDHAWNESEGQGA